MLDEIQVAHASGELVPLGAFTRVERTAGAADRQPARPASRRDHFLQSAAWRRARRQRDPHRRAQDSARHAADGLDHLYGTAKTFQDSLANQGLLILGAIITIYIVLGILYESFIHPLTILSGLPSAAAGRSPGARLSASISR